MSKETNQRDSEEVDMIILFNYIGKVFSKLFAFIGSIFKAIYSVFFYALKIIIDYFKIIGIVMLVMFAIGWGLEKFTPPLYQSDMLVKPYFDSKYQLVSNINYFNSLIDTKNDSALAGIFGIPATDAKKLKKFKITTGPETENQILQQYDSYLQTIDSVRAQNISYDQFVENRDIYSSELYLISVESYKRDIFQHLELGFDSIFSNVHSAKKMEVRDKTFEIRKKYYEKDIERLDSLQNVYIYIKKKESERGEAITGIQGVLPLQQEKATTFEYEVLKDGRRIRDSIRSIEQIKNEEGDFYDVMSGFQKSGSRLHKFENKFSIIFPLAAFIILIVFFILKKTITYVKNHES